MAEPNGSRRVFLRVLAACAAAPAASACSGGVAGPEPVGQVDAGLTSNYPVGSLRAIGTQPIALGHDKDGYYAMTLTCTHQGCNMAVSGVVQSQGVSCGCHGARFDQYGEVLSGPAQASLAHFAVNIDPSTNDITIDGDTEVTPDTRA
jgi:Rieske Fe-S protein